MIKLAKTMIKLTRTVVTLTRNIKLPQAVLFFIFRLTRKFLTRVFLKYNPQNQYAGYSDIVPI
jgi:hypothetical protein